MSRHSHLNMPYVWVSTPLLRFGASLGLFPHLDVSCFIFFRLVLFLGLCFRFVKCFSALSAVGYACSNYHIENGPLGVDRYIYLFAAYQGVKFSFGGLELRVL